MPMPCIIHWNFNHFVVFEGFRRSAPGSMIQPAAASSYPGGEFSEKFTGVVLAMEPGEGFTRGGPKSKVYAPLLRFSPVPAVP